MSATDTKSLVVDYVQYQLKKKALPWPGHPELSDDADDSPSKVNETMRVLGEEFEERYTQVINELIICCVSVSLFLTLCSLVLQQ